MHGYDFASRHVFLTHPSFVAARNADLNATNCLDVYQKQDGEAGLQETFAESAARSVATGSTYASVCPNLYRFWVDRVASRPPTGRNRRPELPPLPRRSS